MQRSLTFLLLVSVLVVATCGLIYELAAGTLASYLLGDSITQFSTIIGVYLFAMGIGSWLSKFFERNLLAWFIQIEIMVGVVGGCSSAILFLLFPHIEFFRLLLYLLIFITGALVGLEIPLLLRILKSKFEFKDLVSKVFTFDYIGALLASVVFPLVLVPFLGLVRTSFLFGILNVAVAYILCHRFREEIPWANYLKGSALTVMLLLAGGFAWADEIMTISETATYNERVVYSVSSPYQRIVLTKNNHELRLYLNGNLQFSSQDEYRYHEALVHPAMQSIHNPRRVLILGGGDGLALREILKYPSVDSVTLVDLDPEMTYLFSTNETLRSLNHNSLHSSRLKIVNADAFEWLRSQRGLYDFICVDFPDPGNYSVGKLYTLSFYKELARVLAPEGKTVIQSTSPLIAPKSYWCVYHTVEKAGMNAVPYHTYVPSFGEWGFILGMKETHFSPPDTFMSGLNYLSGPTFLSMMEFPHDMSERPTEINKLNNQILVHYFEDEWAGYQ